jgi:hypothetical protein
MKIANEVHESQPWRIRGIAPDFTVEDVWALPVSGAADEFQTLLDLMSSLDPGNSESLVVRGLWRARDRLGGWFDLGRIAASADASAEADVEPLPIPGTTETTLRDRLPDDLRDTAAAAGFRSTPFVPLYRTEDEYAAELSNRTVHAVMHLAWVDQGGGVYGGQLAVYVKSRGALGTAYMAFIKPFRLWLVYPALMRRIAQLWDERPVPAADAQRDLTESSRPRRRVSTVRA